MKYFSTPIINAKAADKHMLDIQSQHNDILQGMRDQFIKVQSYNQEAKERKDVNGTNKINADIERMKIKTEADKNRQEDIRKNKELELKKIALLTD